MTLLATVFAAIISTAAAVIYRKKKEARLWFLALMYWLTAAYWAVQFIRQIVNFGWEFYKLNNFEVLCDYLCAIPVTALILLTWVGALHLEKILPEVDFEIGLGSRKRRHT